MELKILCLKVRMVWRGPVQVMTFIGGVDSGGVVTV